MRRIDVLVNGMGRTGYAEDRMTLADFLREELGLTGTHVGCEHGVCGACTVLLDKRSVRSCLMFAVQAAGHEVVTVEGLETADGMSPLQEAMRATHAFQCGFCTPGFLMVIRELLDDHVGELSRAAIREHLSGNICRCSGYQPIVDAVQLAMERESVIDEAPEVSA